MIRPTLILIIGSILGLIFLVFLYALLRRSWRKRRYGLLDAERAKFAPLVDALVAGGGDIEGLRKAANSLEWIAIEDLLFKALDDPAASKEAVLSLFERLGYAHHYISSLRHGNKWERAGAAEKLGRIGCRRVAPHLVKELNSEYRDVCNMAVYSLGAIRDAKAIPYIMERLVKAIENREEVSIRIIKSSLIAFGSPAVPHLLRELGNPSWKIRAAVVDMLGELPSPDSVRALTVALNDTERDVRAKAAKGLGKLKDPSSALPLIEHMEDPHWVVRLHVTRALGLIRDPVAVEYIEKRLYDIKWQVRKAAAEALGRFGGSAFVELLDVYLNSHDRYSKEQASAEIAKAGLLGALATAVLTKEMTVSDDITGILKRAQSLCKTYRNISLDVFFEMLLLLSRAGREKFGDALAQFAAEELDDAQREEVIDAVEKLVRERRLT
ncbi:MAG: HEAT repeat domain-containing protein [Thermodesulfobacteriota bacterium]